MDQDEAFRKRLEATFAVEAQEHLKGITDALLALEKPAEEPRRDEIVEGVFREAHSLKGAARAVNRTDVESLCQAFEGVFAALKHHGLALSAELFDLMQRGRDLLARLLAAPEARAGEGERRRVVEALSLAAQGEAPQPEGAPEPEAHVTDEAPPVAGGPSPAAPAASEETVRVSTAKLATLLLLSEEMVSAKLSAGQHAARIREFREACRGWMKESARQLPELRSVGDHLGSLARAGGGTLSGEDARAGLRILEFLEWSGDYLKALEARAGADLKSAERDSRMLGGMVDGLLEEVKKVMMFPFSSLLEAFPKVVRDLSRDYGKEVDLQVRGEELEIDRRILEEMKDPFLHLVRNAICHGIEAPAQREPRRKPRRGTISIDIGPRDGKAEIAVADDGAGVDVGRLREVVGGLGGGLRDQAQQMGEAELLPFIFQSGVSTSRGVTEISGRGLGLAIVREKVEKLGGSVSVEAAAGVGTRFRIVLPLSVVTFRGLMVRVVDRTFVLPALHVERAVRVKGEDVATVQNRETIVFNGRVVILVRLGDVLELPRPTVAAADGLQAVVVTLEGKSVAFAVDEVLNEREILMKSFGPQLSRVRNVAGATLLGSGRPVPVLNVPDLLKSALRGERGAAPAAALGVVRQRRILVAEDSITSRMLLKNILESAGHGVTTAVDGLDAFTRLKEGAFDLVVSDVDMPRMNGFELTSRIRADRELAELPVVLVTALGSREDRERGVDAGASAYIVKGSFDQSDLLETVRRLC